MENENGVRTSNVEESSTLDHVLGIKGGSTRRQPVDKLAQQLLASGPMRAALPISGSNTLYFATKAAMQAANLSSSAVASNLISAWVYADELVENNGIYKPIAGTPVTWQRVLDLPMQWAEAEQIAGTTANAIKARTTVPVSRSLIVALPITAANTAAPSVSFNGGTALSIVSNSGNSVAVGGLSPPMLVWGFADYDAGKFRLINDQVASAIVAAAEAAANSAKGYRDDAQEMKTQAAASALAAKNSAEQAAQSSSGSIETALNQAAVVASADNADKFFMLVDGKLKAITKASLSKMFGTPIGTTIMMQGNGNNPPPGYLLHNGAAVTSAYADLRAWLLENGANVNGNGDPIIEDMGGYFARGWRSGQLVDSGRVFGSVQQDALQDHAHTVPSNNSSNFGYDKPALGNGVSNAVNPSTTGPIANGGGSTARVAAETRPVNKTFTYWIKAYAADQVPGSVDFAALANNVQTLQNAVNRSGRKKGQRVAPSGTSILYSGLPSGISEVTLNLRNVTFTPSAAPIIRLGTSPANGGVITSGYTGGLGAIASNVGYSSAPLDPSGIVLLGGSNVNPTLDGEIRFTRVPGTNNWAFFGQFFMPAGSYHMSITVNGGVALPGELDRIQLSTASPSTATIGGTAIWADWETAQ